MATREENLKKINDQLEMLTDEELENVAGGTNIESADDSKFLNSLLAGTGYHQCKCYSTTDLADDIETRLDVLLSWKSVGIEVKLGDSSKNLYLLNGKEISRDAALAHAKKTVGKI